VAIICFVDRDGGRFVLRKRLLSSWRRSREVGGRPGEGRYLISLVFGFCDIALLGCVSPGCRLRSGRFVWPPARESLSLVIPAKAGGAFQQRSWSSGGDIASLMRVSRGCRLRSGRFSRLPAPESLFFAGPKKSNPKKWPHRLVAWDGYKPGRCAPV
jgi:hypothetical protein